MNPQRVINVASVPHRSPFRYPGGKTWLVPYVRTWLRSKPEPVETLAEPFAGGAIVGLSTLFEGLCKRLVLVELDTDVAAVWHTVVNGDADKLARMIERFRMSREAASKVLSKKPKNLLERAFATILRNRVQRGGIMAPGASLMKNGENGRGVLSRWYPNTLSRRIRAIAEKRDRIQVAQGDGIQYIHENAHARNMAFFIDPPYTVAGRRLYTHSQVDHPQLFGVVSEVAGDFLMSYDNAEPVRKLAAAAGFDTELVAMKNTHHTVMSELLIGKHFGWLRKHSPQLFD